MPPAGFGPGYGVIVAISADGETLATFDRTKIYVFTRASTSVAFPTAPTQTLHPSVFDLGVGLSLSADGALLACGATSTGGSTEILIYTRQGSAFGASPQVVPVTTTSTVVEMAALAPDGSELAYASTSSGISLLPRTGSTFSATPSQTIPRPTGASTFFGDSGALSTAGSTLAVADVEAGGSGTVFVYTGSPLASTPAQTIAAPTGEHDFGTSLTLRADGEELVEGATYGGGQLGIYFRGAAGYQRVQTLPAPAGASSDFGVSVAVAFDGTLVVSDYGPHIYVYAFP
jgi:hypothetical protein